MEFLTIREHQSSHFRGMDRHQNDSYSNRHPEDFHQNVQLPGLRRESSPTRSHQHDSNRLVYKSSPWTNAPSSSSTANHSHMSLSVNTSAPAVSRPGASSIASLLQSQDHVETIKTKHESPEWNHPAQPVPIRPSSQAIQDMQSREDQQNLKLPSFNSLVEQLGRDPEMPNASRSVAPVTEAAWKRQELAGSFSPVEPLTFQFGGHGSSGRNSMSTSAVHQIASSEPTSPHAYSSTSAHRHPLSPRGRPLSPRSHHRTHVRRTSDLRSRAYSQLNNSSSRELHLPPSYPSGHHQRTQTFPSFPAPSGTDYKNGPYPSLLPPQGSGPEFSSMTSIPGGMIRHPHIAPAPPSHLLGHSRNDSVLNSTEDGRFYSSTFQSGSSGSSHARKRRGNLPKDATRVLRQWFDEHLDAPYPGEEVKNQLCMRTGLQMSQVNNWFINARRRLPRNDRTRKERESTDISEGSPSRDRMPKQPCPPDYWPNYDNHHRR